MKSLPILLAIIFGFMMPAAQAGTDIGSVPRKHDLSRRHHYRHHHRWSVHHHPNPVHFNNPV